MKRKNKITLSDVYKNYYKNYFSYPTFRKLFLEHKEMFKDVKITKFPKYTTYEILDENGFVKTFNNLFEIEKI